MIVHYRNDLTHNSAIHWHGIELSNAMDGTPFTQNQVPPGEEFLYKFKVTRPGVYWYHPHHHSSTNQVYKGLYGMILVEDPNEAALIADGTLPPAAQTVPLVLSDITVCKTPGSNDTQTFPTGATVPWSGPGGALMTVQPAPHPVTICETSPHRRGRQPARPVRRRRRPEHPAARPGARERRPDRPDERDERRRARRLAGHSRCPGSGSPDA